MTTTSVKLYLVASANDFLADPLQVPGLTDPTANILVLAVDQPRWFVSLGGNIVIDSALDPDTDVEVTTNRTYFYDGFMGLSSNEYVWHHSNIADPLPENTAFFPLATSFPDFWNRANKHTHFNYPGQKILVDEEREFPMYMKRLCVYLAPIEVALERQGSLFSLDEWWRTIGQVSSMCVEALGGPDAEVLRQKAQNGDVPGMVETLVNDKLSAELPATIEAELKEARARLHQGAIGQIVTIDDSYGQPIPDNLQLCDGGVIDNPLAHPSLKNKYVKDLREKVVAGATGSNVGTSSGSETSKLKATDIPRDLKYQTPSFSYTPSGSITINDLSKTVYTSYNYTVNNSSSTSNNKRVWLFDTADISGNSFEIGSGIGGSTHKYPRLFDGDYLTESSLYHRHTVAIDHEHTGSFTGSKYTFSSRKIEPSENYTQTEVSVMQPTVFLNKYMVIY